MDRTRFAGGWKWRQPSCGLCRPRRRRGGGRPNKRGSSLIRRSVPPSMTDFRPSRGAPKRKRLIVADEPGSSCPSGLEGFAPIVRPNRERPTCEPSESVGVDVYDRAISSRSAQVRELQSPFLDEWRSPGGCVDSYTGTSARPVSHSEDWGSDTIRRFGLSHWPVNCGFYECGEMSEWLKEHAWKLIPLARADAHRNALTQFPPTTFRNIDVRRRIPVTHGV